MPPFASNAGDDPRAGAVPAVLRRAPLRAGAAGAHFLAHARAAQVRQGQQEPGVEQGCQGARAGDTV